MLEMTGTDPRLIFGSLQVPVCELRMDSGARHLVSTCAITSPAGRRLTVDDDEDRDVTRQREELTELKLEVAELRRQMAELTARTP